METVKTFIARWSALLLSIAVASACAGKTRMSLDDGKNAAFAQAPIEVNEIVYQPPFSIADAVLWSDGAGIGFAMMDAEGRILPFSARKDGDSWSTFYKNSTYSNADEAVRITTRDEIEYYLGLLQSVLATAEGSQIPGAKYNRDLAREFLGNVDLDD